MVIAAPGRRARSTPDLHALIDLEPGPVEPRRLAGVGTSPPAIAATTRSSGDDLALRDLLSTQEAERRRIARDLHDVVGQALTAVRLNLEAIRREPGGRTTDLELRRSLAIVDQAMRDVRDIAMDIRPAILDDLGLVAAARWYVARQGRQAGYRTTFAADPGVDRVDETVGSACFRALQEALTNVARHAGASRVRVEIRRDVDALTLLVEDDGVGFDIAEVRRRRSRPHIGLTGLVERVCVVGGSVEFAAASGQGARILARFPGALPHPRPSIGTTRRRGDVAG